MREKKEQAGRDEELSSLLERLPVLPSARGHLAVVNCFLASADDQQLVLIVGHLRFTLPRQSVVKVESIETDPDRVTAPAVRVTVALPLTILDLCESMPEDIVRRSDRPFAIATRPTPPDYSHPQGYREMEAAFLDARGIR
ncbi:hypothetical protein ABZ572_35115 [Streptomyces sp. NPDC018338]|uniref:hypothetical protein n=1 Tax=Streptomyces sp. NPDC018338 TaxID=3157192 RepID=UPI0033ED1D7D